MKHITLLITLTSLLIMLSGALMAQEIKGQVVDQATGEKLPGANVYLKRDLNKGTTTLIDGSFKLNFNDFLATDTLIISFIGYEEKRIALSKALGKDVKVLLTPATQRIDEVVVRAERLIAEEFNFKKISRIEIYKNPSAKADPLLAINSLPSATTTDESANVSFRGGGPNETGIFFNDVPIYNSVRFAGLNGIGTFSIFNTSIVKDVLVFPGNPPLEYGNTTSGVISIHTDDRIPVKNQNSAVVSPASFGFNRYQRIGDKSALTFFTNYSPSSIIRSLNGEALRDILKFRSNDLGLHFVHQFTPSTSLRFFNYAITEAYEINLEQPTFEGIFEQQKKRNFSILNLKKSFSNSSISFNSGFSISKTDFTYSRTDIDLAQRDYFIGLNYSSYGVKDEFKFGLSLDNRRQKFKGSVPEFDFAEGPDHPTIRVNNSDAIASPELYGYYKRSLSEKLTLGVGTRKNIPVNDHEDYWSGQFNLHFKPGKYLQVILGAGQYHQQQFSRGEESNFQLKSKQISADFKFSKNLFDQSISFFLKQNSGITNREVKGLEYFANLRVGSKMRAQVSLTAIEAIDDNGELRYSSPFDIGLFIKGGITRELPFGMSATVNFLWRRGTHFRPVEDAEFIPDLNAFRPISASLADQQRFNNYRIVDLALNKMHPISEKLTIIYFASINNVFDFENERGLSYNFDYSVSEPQYFSRQSVYFGASLNF